jgi:small subunit ribosomal protein S17
MSSENQKERGVPRVIVGTVTSNKMDKTVVVTVTRRLRHKHFHKFISRRLKYRAHDEKNECNIGDVVELVAAKPTSKTKRWRFSRTIEKAREELQ